jgi:hypothetical protein
MGASASSRKLANPRTYYLSSFLFATPTWKEGVGRLLDFSDSLTEYNDRPTPDEADLLAMWLDWRAVGLDIQDAMVVFTANYDTLPGRERELRELRERLEAAGEELAKQREQLADLLKWLDVDRPTLLKRLGVERSALLKRLGVGRSAAAKRRDRKAGSSSS